MPPHNSVSPSSTRTARTENRVDARRGCLAPEFGVVSIESAEATQVNQDGGTPRMKPGGPVPVAADFAMCSHATGKRPVGGQKSIRLKPAVRRWAREIRE